jgi:hypothetical protein
MCKRNRLFFSTSKVSQAGRASRAGFDMFDTYILASLLAVANC